MVGSSRRCQKENPRIREDGGFHGVFATALRPIPGVRCSRCNPHEGEPYGGGLTIKDADGFHAGLNVLDVYGVLAGVEPAPSSAFVMAYRNFPPLGITGRSCIVLRYCLFRASRALS